MNKQSNNTEQAVATTTAQNILSFSGAWSVKPKLLFAAASLALVVFSSCKKDDKKTEEPPPATPITPSDPVPVYGTVNDIEGNSYKTVVIGTQTWTAENLRSTKYNDGTSILNLTDPNQWYSTDKSISTNTLYAQGAYCYYNNADSNKTKYGALYNWYAVNSDKLVPAGWRVATPADYKKLFEYVYKTWKSYAALKDKSWKYSNGSDDSRGTNASGFSALPAGRREGNQDFNDVPVNSSDEGFATFWTPDSTGTVMRVTIRGAAGVYNGPYATYFGSGAVGCSIRYIKN